MAAACPRRGGAAAEMAAVLNAERLEVSVDGLTLSPDPEERPGAEGAPLLPPPLPPPSPPGSGRGPCAAGERPEPGEAAEEEARRLEQRWGFGLEELYGLALRFFKGEPAGPPATSTARSTGQSHLTHPCWAQSSALGAPEVGAWSHPRRAWTSGSPIRGPPPRSCGQFT